MDAGFERRIVAALVSLCCLLSCGERVELPPLRSLRQPLVADVLDELVDLGVLRVDVRSLIDARQKRRLPVLRLLNRIAAGDHRDEAGQILVLGPQAVGEPRAHAGPHQPRLAAVHQQQRRLVIGHVGVHRADDGDVVDVLGRVRERSR